MGTIVSVIVVLYAIVSAIGKAIETRKQQGTPAPQPPLIIVPPELSTEAAQRRNRIAQELQRKQQRQQPRKPAQRATRNGPPPARQALPPAPANFSPDPVPVARPAPQAPAVKAAISPVAPSAKALHAWLNPRTLRSQFLITEILNPPVTLREQHLH